MKFSFIILIIFAFANKIIAQKPAANNTPATVNKCKNLKDSASYSIGFNIGQNIAQQNANLNNELFIQGIRDAISKKKPVLDPNQASAIIGAYMNKQGDKKSIGNIKEGEKFLAENKKKKGVIQTASGLQYEVLTLGTGAKPLETDKVKVNYEGRLLNGKVFDASARNGGPIEFPLNGVIKGWTEGVQLMPVGSKFRFYIPSKLAYGNNGAGADIAPGATLIFDVELLDIVKPTENPKN